MISTMAKWSLTLCRLSEHKRLDYVVEHQVLTTSSETYDIEVTMAIKTSTTTATNNFEPICTHTHFTIYYTFTVLLWRHFSTYGKRTSLALILFILQVFQMPGMGLMAAMAHHSTSSGSAVYLWSQSGFQLYQSISTYGALSWRHFTLGKKVWRRKDTQESTGRPKWYHLIIHAAESIIDNLFSHLFLTQDLSRSV